ncbi:hypothetical protein JCM8547_008347 [Rhodosporidiobolus lusitaniae]
MAPPRAPPTTSTSSSTPAFPRLSPHQHQQLDRIVSHCHPTDHSWHQLSHARTLATQHSSARSSTEDDGDEDGLYQLLLALTWQDGATWHQKWNNAQLNQQGEGEDDTGPLERHRRRPSDGVDLLRKKLANVHLPSSSAASPATGAPRRAPSIPLETAARMGGTPRFSSRPRSTPPAAATPRPLLVHAEPGYSSSDDYVGVPRAGGGAVGRASGTSRPAERVQGGREKKDESTLRAVSAAREDATPLSRRPAVLKQPHQPAVEPIFASSPTTAKHPLLSRRLAELSHPPETSPSPSALPPPQTLTSSLPPRSTRPTPPPSSIPDLIASFSPPEAYALASSFSRLRLLGSAFDTWREAWTFLRDRERELDERRGTWLVRCAMQGWRERLARVREGERKAEEWAGPLGEGGRRRRMRVLRETVRRWKGRVEEKKREKEEERKRAERGRREGELKSARDEVVRLRNRGVAKRALERWYHAHHLSRSTRFRRHSLLSTSFRTLQLRLSTSQQRARELQRVADETWGAKEQDRAVSLVREWRRRREVREAERVWVGKKEDEVKRDAIERWSDRRRQAEYVRELEAAADQQYGVNLASSALESWKRRKRHLDSFSALSLTHSTSLLFSRSNTLLHHWRLRTRLSLSLRSSSHALASRSLATWLNRYEHLETELLGRCVAFTSRKDAQLLTVAFSAWHDAASHQSRLTLAADAVSRRNALAGAVGRWKKRVEKLRVEERKADVVWEFMGQRGAWRRWVERAWERKRERWEGEKRRGRKREALQFWLAQTRQKQQDRALVLQVQQQSNQRLLSSTVTAWKSRIILRRELENEANKLFERNLQQAGFKRWAEQTVKAAERLGFADEYRAGKLEELRDRAFHAWLSSTRRSLELKHRLASFTDSRQARLRETAFGTWRERALRRIEAEVRQKREERLRRMAWEGWKHQTRALTATQFHSSRLLRSAFKTWEQWTPPVELVRQAVESDRNAIGRGAVQVWRIKAQARVALKGLSRLRPLNSSPSPVSPPAPHPPSNRSSPSTFSRSPTSSLSAPQATPTPSLLPRRRVIPPSSPSSISTSTPARTISTERSPSAFVWTAATTPATSYRPSRPLSTASRSILSSSSSAPSPLPPPQSAKAPSTPLPGSSSSSSRPRLSAALAGLPSSSSSASRPPRTRSRSISSLRSVGTSRSAPAGSGAAVVTSDESEDEDEERRGGGRLLDRPAGRGRGAAKSEGASSVSGRDVRGEYAALKARLKEAAVRARTGL